MTYAREGLTFVDLPPLLVPAKEVGTVLNASQKVVRSLVKSFRDLIVKKFAESLITNFDISCRYITAKSMISEIQASYSIDGRSEGGEVQRFVEYEVLIIDEIDAIPARDNAALLTEVINQRYNALRPIVVITNQPFDDLAKFVGDPCPLSVARERLHLFV